MVRGRLIALASLVLCLLDLAGSLAAAQDGGLRLVDPRPYGIELPPGLVSPGENRAVTTLDDDGQPVVGRLHVKVGEGGVILLPDGQLIVRRAGKFDLTEHKPFVRALPDPRFSINGPLFLIVRNPLPHLTCPTVGKPCRVTLDRA